MQNSLILFIYGSGEEGLLKCFIVELCTVQFLHPPVSKMVLGSLLCTLSMLTMIHNIVVHVLMAIFGHVQHK